MNSEARRRDFESPGTRARVLSRLADPAAALSDVARAIRSEVEANMKASGIGTEASVDGFKISRYTGRPLRKTMRRRFDESSPPRKGLNAWSLKPLPGEVRLTAFILKEVQRCGVSGSCVLKRLNNGFYPKVTVRRPNQRAAFVTVKGALPPASERRPGEILLRDFVRDEAARCGVRDGVIYERLRSGYYPGVKRRAVHPRCVYVRVISNPAQNPFEALPGEITMKEFVRTECQRLGVRHLSVIYRRVSRGLYPQYRFRKVNRRKVFVSTKKDNE